MSRTSFSFSSYDLQLREQQLGERHASALASSRPDGDLVAHAERADEDVDLPTVLSSKNSAALAVHRVERRVRRVAEPAEERCDLARRALRRDEVDVAVGALQ